MVSPGPVLSSALSSKTSAILVASIEGDGDISTTVGSSIVFPSVASPSSLTSVTSLTTATSSGTTTGGSTVSY